MTGRFQNELGEFAHLASNFFVVVVDWLAGCGEMWLWADFRETMRACFTAGQHLRHSLDQKNVHLGNFQLTKFMTFKFSFLSFSNYRRQHLYTPSP